MGYLSEGLFGPSTIGGLRMQLDTEWHEIIDSGMVPRYFPGLLQ
jgi:hypothetical protein